MSTAALQDETNEMPDLDFKTVRRRVEAALAELFRSHERLMAVDANERSVTHHLANCIAAEFTDWDVDAEYNRDGYDPKQLQLPASDASSDDTNAKTVYPDVIVHRRGTKDNCLVLEVKKATGGSIDHDHKKLKAFTSADGLGYTWGVHLVIGETEQGSKMRWFANGAALE